jgi:hypothetical protein
LLLSVPEALRPNYDQFLRYILRMKIGVFGLVGVLLLTSCGGGDGGDDSNLPFSEDPRCATLQQYWLGLQMEAESTIDEVEKQRLLRLADSTEQQISFIENCSLE